MGSVVGREDPRALAPSSELEGPPGLGSVTQSTDRPERVEPDVDQGLEDTLDWKHDKEGDTEPHSDVQQVHLAELEACSRLSLRTARNQWVCGLRR